MECKCDPSVFGPGVRPATVLRMMLRVRPLFLFSVHSCRAPAASSCLLIDFRRHRAYARTTRQRPLRVTCAWCSDESASTGSQTACGSGCVIGHVVAVCVSGLSVRVAISSRGADTSSLRGGRRCASCGEGSRLRSVLSSPTSKWN